MGPERAIPTAKDVEARENLLSVKQIAAGEALICFVSWATGMNALVEDWFEE